MGSGAYDWKLDGKAAAALAKVERQFQHIGATKRNYFGINQHVESENLALDRSHRIPA
jgi:hypothetical protein